MSKKKRKGGEYVNMRTLFKEGKYKFAVPLDYMIMEKLPDAGATIGGVIPLGRTLTDLVADFDGAVENTMILGRLRSLKAAGLVEIVRLPKTEGDGWQVTRDGKKIVTAWQKNGKEAL